MPAGMMAMHFHFYRMTQQHQSMASICLLLLCAWSTKQQRRRSLVTFDITTNLLIRC
ncbi:uncharacterized protein M421DRAFT_245116 [Didymella exigua CBS 183.55]|uniref:Uncharacterized protein n=1 Tax=Didymella exigua CBS 183.55 TaxID=1150837 RepID=A0A6A5RZF2_9PLEO|nr:uncharacterized protein M421DRAFT_245116 [Didymella exigua CBS 183.55]KAF1932614.1 hypothetical protein M421DRAFT_245116 [Didymella exigua CBS 183.55]